MARTARLCIAAFLALAVSTAEALSCGTTLIDVPMSGCTACTEVNVTGMGRHGGPGGARFGRKMLHSGNGGGPDGRPGGAGFSALMPSCTACDATGSYVLVVRNETGTGRCGCADSYGVVVTSNATITIGNFTKTIPQFDCVKCSAGQVPLGPKSNIKPSYSNGTWTLVLANTTATSTSTSSGTPVISKTVTSARNTTRRHRKRHNTTSTAKSSSVSLASLEVPFVAATSAAAAPMDAAAAHGGPKGFGGFPGGPGGYSPGPRPNGDGGFGGHGPDGDGAGRPPYIPGQCVACPTGSSTTDGVTCLA